MDTFEQVHPGDTLIDPASFERPAHLSTVWNYPQRYGGELYTVRWESDLLEELSESVSKLAMELASTAGQQVMKTTIAAAIFVAAGVPLTVMSVRSEP